MSVDIGFLEKTDPKLLQSYYFPSKVGGFPAWLSLKDLPKAEDLKCQNCLNQLIFLCQIYAPYEEDLKNFHRTLFVFICRNYECWKKNGNNIEKPNYLKVVRSTLERKNEFYDFEPPTEKTKFNLESFVKICALCGCWAEKHCSKCKDTHYCCREHQVLDWKSGHKNFCQDRNFLFENKVIYPEFELVIEEECIDKSEKNEEEKMVEYKKLVENKIEALHDVSETELDNHVTLENCDKTFLRFKKRIENFPDQVLRYEKGGEPLYISETSRPNEIPNCEYCCSERQFEFQILPQLLYELKEDTLDWGTLLIYTCKNSCQDGPEYKNEFIFRQDVSE